jgi:hypothetical protein
MSILYDKDARGWLDGRPQLCEAFEGEPRCVRGVIEDDVDGLACCRGALERVGAESSRGGSRPGFQEQRIEWMYVNVFVCR